MVCSNLNFKTSHDFSFSGKYHGILSKQAETRLTILMHHLKDLSLSFQKIIKLTLLDQQTKVMAVQIIMLRYSN